MLAPCAILSYVNRSWYVQTFVITDFPSSESLKPPNRVNCELWDATAKPYCINAVNAIAFLKEQGVLSLSQQTTGYDSEQVRSPRAQFWNSRDAALTQTPCSLGITLHDTHRSLWLMLREREWGRPWQRQQRRVCAGEEWRAEESPRGSEICGICWTHTSLDGNLRRTHVCVSATTNAI